MNVALFDYGAGNLHSLGKALEAAGVTVTVTSDWGEALQLDALVLPGVGAFGHAAGALPADRAPLRRALEAGLPCLGICLGMQLLFQGSEESDGDGIGLVPGGCAPAADLHRSPDGLERRGHVSGSTLRWSGAFGRVLRQFVRV